MKSIMGKEEFHPGILLQHIDHTPAKIRMDEMRSNIEYNSDGTWSLASDEESLFNFHAIANYPLSVLVRNTTITLKEHDLLPRMVGKTLQMWMRTSKLAPWEHKAHFLVGTKGNEKETIALINVCESLIKQGFRIFWDEGGARVMYSDSEVQKRGSVFSKFVVYLYMRDPDHDTVAVSLKGSGIDSKEAKKHRITQKDMYRKIQRAAVLEWSILVYAPIKESGRTRYLVRWFNGLDKGRIPPLSPPKLWTWNSEEKRYVKTSFFNYLFCKPFGIRTMIGWVIIASIVFTIYLIYNWVSNNSRILFPSPKLPSSTKSTFMNKNRKPRRGRV